jgi:hypothetical protein
MTTGRKETMKRTRIVRGLGALAAALMAVLLIAGPAQADWLDELPISAGASGAGTYTGTQDGNAVTGEISVELVCVFVVCFGGVTVDDAGGFTIGLAGGAEAPFEFRLRGIQIGFGGERLVNIDLVTLSVASDGSFEWDNGTAAVSGQLDSGGFTIG